MAGVDRGKTPLDARLMGLDVVDLFFNLNLPGVHPFKYGDDFIEFFVGSHNRFFGSYMPGQRVCPVCRGGT